MKLCILTYQNIYVLRHFRHCRAVESPPNGKKARFRALGFYRETAQQSFQLFSPLRSSRSPTVKSLQCKSILQSAVAEQQSAFCASREKILRPLTPQMRRHGWHRIRAGLLWLRQIPYRLGWKWNSFWQERKFRAKVRALRRQEQTFFIREQHRIATSAQAALFLSLANTIDLKTAKELAVLCQHVSKQRRRRKMTTEDLTCFDQALNDIDNNYATLLTSVQ